MSTELTLMLIAFAVFMVTRIPLSFAMLLSSSLYMLSAGKDLEMVAHRMFTGIDTFTLMAIPFSFSPPN